MRVIDLNGSGAEFFDDTAKVLQGEALEKLGSIIRAQLGRLENPN